MITLKEAKEKFDYVFVLYFINNGDCNFEHELFIPVDEINDYLNDDNITINKIYGTSCIEPSFDAYSLVENGCEEMYEDCFDDVINSGGVEVLQRFLDKWCKKYVQPTYQVETDIKIIIPEES